MSDLVNLKCENCGAVLSKDLTCPFCGARYERKYNAHNELVYVKVAEGRVDRLATEMRIPKETLNYMKEEDTAEIAMHKMSSALASQLAKYMQVDTHFDPFTQTQIIRGEVKVVRPDFRFIN